MHLWTHRTLSPGASQTAQNVVSHSVDSSFSFFVEKKSVRRNAVQIFVVSDERQHLVAWPTVQTRIRELFVRGYPPS